MQVGRVSFVARPMAVAIVAFTFLYASFGTLVMADDSLTVEQVALLGGPVHDVVSWDGQALLAIQDSLAVLDLTSDPIAQVATLPVPATSIAATGDLACAAASGRLWVLDISEPNTIEVAGEVAVANGSITSGGIAMVDERAYLALGEGGLAVVDISTPSSPQLLGTAAIPATAAAASGSHVYVVSADHEHLVVVDAANPASPDEITRIRMTGVLSLDIAGNHLFVSGGNDFGNTKGITIYDISTPASPAEIGSYGVGDLNVGKVRVTGDLALLDTFRKLVVVDVSDPASPQPVGELQRDGQGYLIALAADQSAAYLAVGDSDDLFRVVDLSDPEQPELEKSFSAPEALRGAAAVGRYLLVGSWDRLYSYDLSSPASPQLVAGSDQWTSTFRMAASDDLAVQSDYDGPLSLIDVSNPAIPTEVGTYEPGGTPNGLALASSTLLVTTAADELEVVDVSNPASPELLGSVAFQGPAKSLAVAADGSAVFVAHSDGVNGGVHIIDLANPALPTLSGSAEPSGKPSGIAVEGTTLFVSSFDDDPATWYLQAFDVSGSSAAPLLGTASGAGATTWDVAVRDGVVLLATRAEGISAEDGVRSFVFAGNAFTAGPIMAQDDPLEITIIDSSAKQAASPGKITEGGSFAFTSSSGSGYYDISEESGDGGGKVGEVGPPEPPGPAPVSLTTKVSPSGAAAAGCSVDPSEGIFFEGEEVEITAHAVEPWNFWKWEGATGSGPTTTILMDDDKTVTAHFAAPELTLKLWNPSLAVCYSEIRSDPRVRIASATITASEDADWMVQTLSLHAQDNGNVLENVAEVILETAQGAVLDRAAYLEDRSTVVLDIQRRINKGESLSLYIYYRFEGFGDSQWSCGGEGLALKWAVSASGADLAAAPINPPYESFFILPPDAMQTGALSTGCVLNHATSEAFGEIEEALTAATTDPGHTLNVCQGEYAGDADALIINKPAELQAESEQDRPLIWAPIEVTAEEVVIRNFLIRSQLEGMTGITVHDVDNVELTGNIFDNVDFCINSVGTRNLQVVGNRFESGEAAIRIDESVSARIHSNTIIETEYGISLEAGIRPVVEGNRLSLCENGIEVTGGSKNPVLRGNHVSNSSFTGISLEESEAALLTRNVVSGSEAGAVVLRSAPGTRIFHNTISRNCGGIEVESSDPVTIVDNFIESNFCSTGIHINGASPLIEANQIINDATDGIFCENGASPTVTGNNISGNADHGLENSDGSVTVAAGGNWWGHGSGPSGSGSGSGDAVSGGVDFAGWRTEPVAVVLGLAADELTLPPGGGGSLELLVRNWSAPSDTVDLSVSDELGWLFVLTPAAVILAEDGGGLSNIAVVAPADTAVGTTNTVTVTAASRADSTNMDMQTFEVVVANGKARRIPVVAHAQGFGGTAWRSDVAVVNTSSDAAILRLGYRSGDTVLASEYPLEPGAATTWNDVLVSAFGLAADIASSGSLQISSDAATLITSRTYADEGASGTYGQFEPALLASEALGQGTVGVLPQLKKNGSFYTNIGAVNMGHRACNVRVRLYDDKGGQIGGSRTRNLAVGEWYQFNDVFGDTIHDVAYATVETTSSGGLAWFYASVVDALTKDPTTIPVLVPAQTATLWIPGIAHAAGYGGIAWRSAVAAANTTGQTAQIEVRFHAPGSVESRSVALAAGAAMEWKDVLVELFDLDPGEQSSGCLEVTTDQPLAITCRTYADMGTAGTYGQYEPALAPSDMLTSGETGFLPQISSSGLFYTNIGVVNPGTTACAVRVVLFNADGDQVGNALARDVPAGEWYQFNRVFDRAGAGNLLTAYATVEVTSPGGSAWFYASVVDELTKDPTTVPMLRP